MTPNSHQTIHHKKTILYIVLCAIFLTNAIVAEMIGGKIFSLEALLGIAPAQIPLLEGTNLDFNLTAGVVLWPIVFVSTDIINEYFGVQGVRRITFITAGLIAYVFVVIWIATELPPAQFWLEINSIDSEGNPFNINEAYSKVFLQGMGIIVGSLFAFLIGQLLDAWTFQWLKNITNSRKVWLRATGSTLISQLIDSFVVLWVAFYVFGNWELEMVIAVGIMNYIYKFLVAVVLTPFIYLGHFVIDRFLGVNQKEVSEPLNVE